MGAHSKMGSLVKKIVRNKRAYIAAFPSLTALYAAAERDAASFGGDIANHPNRYDLNGSYRNWDYRNSEVPQDRLDAFQAACKSFNQLKGLPTFANVRKGFISTRQGPVLSVDAVINRGQDGAIWRKRKPVDNSKGSSVGNVITVVIDTLNITAGGAALVRKNTPDQLRKAFIKGCVLVWLCEAASKMGKSLEIVLNKHSFDVDGLNPQVDWQAEQAAGRGDSRHSLYAVFATVKEAAAPINYRKLLLVTSAEYLSNVVYWCEYAQLNWSQQGWAGLMDRTDTREDSHWVPALKGNQTWEERGKSLKIAKFVREQEYLFEAWSAIRPGTHKDAFFVLPDMKDDEEAKTFCNEFVAKYLGR